MRFNKNEAWSFGKSAKGIIYGQTGLPGPSDYSSNYETGKRSPTYK